MGGYPNPTALYREHDDKPSKIDINRLDDWATRTCTISPLRVSTQWLVNRPAMLKMNEHDGTRVLVSQNCPASQVDEFEYPDVGMGHLIFQHMKHWDVSY